MKKYFTPKILLMTIESISFHFIKSDFQELSEPHKDIPSKEYHISLLIL